MHPDLHNSGGNVENSCCSNRETETTLQYTLEPVTQKTATLYHFIEKNGLEFICFTYITFLKAKINLQHYIKANLERKMF